MSFSWLHSDYQREVSYYYTEDVYPLHITDWDESCFENRISSFPSDSLSINIISEGFIESLPLPSYFIQNIYTFVYLPANSTGW